MFVFLNTLVWFLVLVMMATLLGKLGVTQFLAEALGEFASAMGLGEISIMIFLSLAFLIRTISLLPLQLIYQQCFLFFIVQSLS